MKIIQFADAFNDENFYAISKDKVDIVDRIFFHYFLLKLREINKISTNKIPLEDSAGFYFKPCVIPPPFHILDFEQLYRWNSRWR